MKLVCGYFSSYSPPSGLDGYEDHLDAFGDLGIYCQKTNMQHWPKPHPMKHSTTSSLEMQIGIRRESKIGQAHAVIVSSRQ